MTNFQIRNTSSSSEESSKSFHQSARDYVESLHQNSKTTLLYGKNNVLVQPVSMKNLLIGMGWQLNFDISNIDILTIDESF